jgi:transposase
VKATNRIHKLLETANIKLATVLSDIVGVSGRAMLRALADGETDPERLAALARGSLVGKKAVLAEALRGRFTAHHAFLLRQLLAQLDHFAALIEACDQQIGSVAEPVQAHIERLQTIAGVGPRSAQVIVSEIGVDMTRFASSAHLASWARICPGTHESAGKRRSAGTGTGNNWLRTTLLESAWAASHQRSSYLGARFRRISKRRGPKRAAIAVAHTILVIAYYVLRDEVAFHDLGPDYFDRLDAGRQKRYYLRRLEALGCDVSQVA